LIKLRMQGVHLPQQDSKSKCWRSAATLWLPWLIASLTRRSLSAWQMHTYIAELLLTVFRVSMSPDSKAVAIVLALPILMREVIGALYWLRIRPVGKLSLYRW
jgi:hypothetical protein